MSDGERAGKIYQLHVTLLGIEPPIWRRFLFRGQDNFMTLHHALQEVMGWGNSHLFQFNVGQIELTDAESAAEFGARDAETIALQELVSHRRAKFRYLYDFGDSWEHEVQVEQLLNPEPEAVYPRCLDGARACPPEDSGGAWGYTYFLEDLAAGELDEEWYEGFDPEAFDVEEINRRLRRAFPAAAL